MKHFILLSIISVLGLSTHAQSNPFESIQYDQVIAYEFNGEAGNTIDLVLERYVSRLNKQLVLSEDQINRFEEIICDEKAYGQTTAACFDPHFAVIYYYKHTPVAQVDVCLDCNYLISSIDIPATSLSTFKIDEEFSYSAKGFSAKSINDLTSFIGSLGFDKYLD